VTEFLINYFVCFTCRKETTRVTRSGLPKQTSAITKRGWQFFDNCLKVSVLDASTRTGRVEVTASTDSQWGTNIGNHGRRLDTAKERCIYPNLKLRIYTTGMRQNLLAKLVGVDEAYLSRIVNGVRVPGEQIRLQIAKVLGCDAKWLFEQFTLEVNRNLVPESTEVE
jgi:hypothetical protein